MTVDSAGFRIMTPNEARRAREPHPTPHPTDASRLEEMEGGVDREQWEAFLRLIAGFPAREEFVEFHEDLDRAERRSLPHPPDDDTFYLDGNPFRIDGSRFDFLQMLLPEHTDLTLVLSPDDLAVRAALAVVALAHAPGGAPCPPADLVAALCAEMYQRAHYLPGHDRDRHRGRALEFALAFLLGWHRNAYDHPEPHEMAWYPLDGRSVGWDGQMGGARELVGLAVRRRVRRCLLWLHEGNYGRVPARGLEENNVNHGVPGVTVVDPAAPANEALREMLNLYSGCGCCDLWGNPDDAETVAAFRHHLTTCVRAHPILSWEPARSTLWEHIDQAVQGVVGPRLDARPFIHGLLHHVLWHAPAEGGPVRLVPQPVAFHPCDHCGETPACPHSANGAPRVLRPRALIRIVGQDFTLQRGAVRPFPRTYQLHDFIRCPPRTNHGDLLFAAPPAGGVCPQCSGPLEATRVPAYYFP